MSNTSQIDRVKALLANYITQADYRGALVRDEDIDEEVAEREKRAAHMLAEMGPFALRALIDLLHTGDPITRERAARALGGFGAAADEAVPALMQALADEWEAIRNAAVLALGQLGRCAVPALAAAWRDRTSKIRWLAAQALTLAGPWAEDAAPILAEVLIEKLKHGDMDGANVCAALKSMGQIGGRAAVPGLLAAEAAITETCSWARHLLSIALRELAPFAVPDLAPHRHYGAGPARQAATVGAIILSVRGVDRTGSIRRFYQSGGPGGVGLSRAAGLEGVAGTLPGLLVHRLGGPTGHAVRWESVGVQQAQARPGRRQAASAIASPVYQHRLQP